jgi:hypothetical protein
MTRSVAARDLNAASLALRALPVGADRIPLVAAAAAAMPEHRRGLRLRDAAVNHARSIPPRRGQVKGADWAPTRSPPR